MHSMMPYNRSFFGQPREVFDPFSLYFWDDFPVDFPAFRAPPLLPPWPAPPLMPPSRPLLPQMREMVPRTKIEYKETPEAHHFKAELPGVRKEDVKVTLEEGGRMIHVSAKSKRGNEEKRENFHHVERSYGEFMSKFMLPPNAKPEHMRSSVDKNGVLTITIPKEKLQQSNYH